MKKITALCLIAVLVMLLFGGCANNKQETETKKQESLTQEADTETGEILTNTQTATVTEIHEGDNLTVTGTLIEESFEYVNGDGMGVAYILNLDEAINVALYDDFAELIGDKMTVDSVQVLSYDGASELVGKHITVTGRAMVWHTQYHIRTIVLTDCEVTE